jgi:hypothetical protein
MIGVFQFGERIPDSEVPVLNEREVRAAAGLFLLFAMFAFSKAWFTGDFGMTRIVALAFFLDFSIRLFVSPRFSPSMIIGRFAVRNQTPEYAGAPQKRFAWALGWLLSGTMVLMVVVWDVRGPANMLICVTCLTLLFFESVFGICVGCKLYNLIPGNRALMCPGGACEIFVRAPIQRITSVQVVSLAAFVVAFAVIAAQLPSGRYTGASGRVASLDNPAACQPPALVVRLGMVDKWKLHNNCP